MGKYTRDSRFSNYNVQSLEAEAKQALIMRAESIFTTGNSHWQKLPRVVGFPRNQGLLFMKEELKHKLTKGSPTASGTQEVKTDGQSFFWPCNL